MSGLNQIGAISTFAAKSTFDSMLNPPHDLLPNVPLLSIPDMAVPSLSNVPCSFDRIGGIGGYHAVRRTPFHVSGDLI